MGPDLQAQIDALKIEIARDEQVLSALEIEVRSLQAELALFKSHYDQIVLPVVERIKMVKHAIKDLENATIINLSRNLPENYITVEEQYRRAWEPAPEPAPTEIPPPSPDPDFSTEIPPVISRAEIKKLYHELARRYHPDTATTEADIEYYTHLMAQINAAYAAGDVDTLNALLHQNGRVDANESLALIHLRDLQQFHLTLRDNIFKLKQQQQSLATCDLMRLKLEESLAKSKGRNLLREMVEGFEREYRVLLRRLYDLRQTSSE